MLKNYIIFVNVTWPSVAFAQKNTFVQKKSERNSFISGDVDPCGSEDKLS